MESVAIMAVETLQITGETLWTPFHTYIQIAQDYTPGMGVVQTVGS